MTVSVNLIVLRAHDIERAVIFYQTLGLEFERHSHGHGPAHYCAELESLVFELYPASEKSGSSKGARIGFSVLGIDSVYQSLVGLGAEPISSPKDSEWGRRAVIRDFDGHSIELLEAIT